MNQLIRRCRLRTTDFDRYCRLQPAAVLELFQDVAAEHAALLGLGFDAMTRRGMLWVVLRVYYEQLAQPQLFDEVQVVTWPHPPGLLDFGRDYRIDAADGSPLVRGTSQWVVIDAANRKMVPSQEVSFPPEAVREEHLIPTRLRKLRDFPAQGAGQTIRSQFTDVDLNGHVNNAKYANYFLNALQPGPEAAIRSFQLDYHHEVLPGQALALHIRREGGTVQCKGCNDAGAVMFSSQLTLVPTEKGTDVS